MQNQNPTIAVINESTVVTDEAVRDLILALQAQVDVDFSPVWHLDCILLFQEREQPIEAGVWQLVILDNSDQAGALGYHELTAHGDPLGKVFAGEDLKYGANWTITASHELLEMLADPWINMCAQVENSFYAYEVCDPCEADEFGYGITLSNNGRIVQVSDFVTPGWFQVGTGASGPFDVRGHIIKALELLPDGYISVLRAGDSNGWVQLSGRFTDQNREARSVPKEGHRRHKRMIGKENWKRSTR